jgi:hypothetical protein
MSPAYALRTTRKRPLQRRKSIDGRTRLARRIRELIAGYTRRLGNAADDPTIRLDIARLAEIEALCEDQRRAALRREPVDLAALTRLQNAARRSRIALGLNGLPPPPPAASPAHRELYPLKHEASHG